ncbi:hypothetical protein FRC12_015421, partial [Ceratobasidium sp. 428]
MGGDHMCPVCSATFTRPQHVARHMRSHTGDRPYGCQMCGDRFARSDLLSRHVNKCHTPGGLANTTGRKGQASRAQAAADDKKKRPCEACTLQSTKCDFGKPCNNCTARGSKCAYAKAKRAPRRDANPSPSTQSTNLPPANPRVAQESHSVHTFPYQDDITPFSFNYPAQDSSLAMPHLYEPGISVPGGNSNAFIGSPEAPSLSFSAATSDSAESTPWNGLDFMSMPGGVPNNGFDPSTMYPDPNAPSFSSAHKLHSQSSHPFAYGIEQTQVDPQQPLTTLHQRPSSAVQRQQPTHHQRHRSTPSLDGPHPLLNSTLLRAQAQQYPAITPNRLYTHRGSISASDSGTDYESSNGRPSTAGEYPDFPSPMSLSNSETGSVGPGVHRALDDMSLHDPTNNNNLLSMGSMVVPGIGMGTGLTPALESPSRPSMTQRQSTFGDLRAFWNECMDGQHNVGGENRHSLTKMTSMPCLKTPLGEVDATPRGTTQDPLARLGQKRDGSSIQTPRIFNQAETKGLEQYQHAVDARQPPSLQIAPKMKAAAAKQEDIDSNRQESSFAVPFPPGTAQADAWRSLMSGASDNNRTSGGSYVAKSVRPSYKRLPSQTLGPENSKRQHHDGNDSESALYTDDEDEDDYKQAQQEWHRRMSLP